MNRIKKEALEKILQQINKLSDCDRSEAITALIRLVGVRDASYVMLDNDYKLDFYSRQYLKELIEKYENQI